MDGPRRYYAKWNKSDRERQTPFDLTYMWNLKNKMNKQNKHGLIDTENKWWLPDERGVGSWVKKVKELRSINW